MPGLAADRREHEAAGYRPGRTVSASSPVDFTRFIAEETEICSQVIREANIRRD
jgi:hypothetical protein